MHIETLRSPLRWLTPRLRLEWLVLAVASVGLTFFELLAAGAVYRLVDRTSAGPVDRSLVLIVAGVFLARSLLLAVVAFLQSHAVSQSIVEAFGRLLRGYLAAPYRFHLGRSTAERIQRLTTAIDVAYRLVLSAAPAVLGELLVMVGLSGLIVAIAPIPVVAAAALLAGGGLLLLIVTRKSVGRWGRQQYDAGQRTIQRLEDLFAGMREIKSGQQEQAQYEGVMTIQRQFTNAVRGHLFALSMPRVTTEAAFAIVGLAVLLIVSGRQSLGILALFAYAGFRLIPSVTRVIYHLDHIRHGAHAVAELGEAMRAVGHLPLPARSPRDDSFRDAITLDDVSFAYDGADTPALAAVSLTIRRGEWVGVTGENGSGKSTLLDLLAGLLQPTAGRVRIDGRSLEEWLETTPPLIGYVAQRPHLFDGEGESLSGGERQGMALRHALAAGPEILLLDEPANSLDREAEARLVDALSAVKGKMTIVVVSHRRETLRHCDRVIVLRGGRVSEPATSSATITRT